MPKLVERVLRVVRRGNYELPGESPWTKPKPLALADACTESEGALARVRLDLMREDRLRGLPRGLTRASPAVRVRHHADVIDVAVKQDSDAERAERFLNELADRHRRVELRRRVNLRVDRRRHPVARLDVQHAPGPSRTDWRFVDDARALRDAVDLDDDVVSGDEMVAVGIAQFIEVEVKPPLRARHEVVLIVLVREEVRVARAERRHENRDAVKIRVIERRQRQPAARELGRRVDRRRRRLGRGGRRVVRGDEALPAEAERHAIPLDVR